ncbi:MAG TPA: HAMP domain-containing sensor histidine kinase, partial [Armatimonadota bacterium]|nr:HAMP domain-containing sensor histidine kinase [Armatimonadota bacterium]
RVMNAVRQMQHIADDYQIEIRTKVSGKPQPIIGDGDRIEQVMTNLLSNAIKFSPPGSAIDVTVRQLRGLIKVSVADQGPGIAPGEREMVFEKFYQGSIQSFSKEVGSGLGLAISKAIVEQHGGSIIVDSNSGKGSVFSFLLPVPAEDTKGAGSLSNKDQHTAQDGA